MKTYIYVTFIYPKNVTDIAHMLFSMHVSTISHAGITILSPTKKTATEHMQRSKRIVLIPAKKFTTLVALFSWLCTILFLSLCSDIYI